MANPTANTAAVRILVSIALIATCALRAQERGEGDGEVAVMSGATLGRIGTHAIIAGSAGARFSRYITGVAEAAVIPMNNQTLFPTPYQVRGSDLFDFNFALQGGVPIKRWEPYGVFGLGVLMNPYTAGIVGPAGGVAYVGQRHSKFALQSGAGCRYFVNERWGFRAEYRYTSSRLNFNRIQAGVFYRIEGHDIFGFLPAFARHFR